MWALTSILSCDESNKIVNMNLVRRLDPRNSLAARIGWVFALLSIASSLAIGWASAGIARRVVERDVASLYADRAEHISEIINSRINASLKALQTTANVLSADNSLYQGQMQGVVAAIHTTLDEETVVSITDIEGHFRAGDLEEGDTLKVTDQQWLKAAALGPIVSLGKENLEIIRANKPKPPVNFGTVIISVPVKNKTGSAFAIAIAMFDIAWFNDTTQMVGYTRPTIRQPDLYIYNRDGALLYTSQIEQSQVSRLSPEIVAALEVARGVRFKGAQVTANFLEGYATQLDSGGNTTDGVIAVVRQSVALAFQPANDTAKYIASLILAAGLILSLAAAFVVSRATDGLSKIADAASALQRGTAREFIAIKGTDEAARISKSLAGLFGQLNQSNANLESMNRTLDQKVNDRTREVKRLSEEMQSAAITRERLRMSRDLHDTLAHSMLAMLTHIRLMRKIHLKKPELLGHELKLAEDAARDGLNEARNAVTELRYFAVRDDGLEEALKKLLAKLRMRLEINAGLVIAEPASSLAGTKAETIFRIAEEALHNVERHSDAKNVAIDVQVSFQNDGNQALTMTIIDDGKGFDVEQHHTGHFGLIGMREQADLLVAKFEVQSAPGAGTRVELMVLL